MKLKNKRLLSYFMIFGDFFMVMIGLILMLDGEMFILGLMMLGFLAVDIYLTFDYIKALLHREKVEKSLQADNERAQALRRQWNRMDDSAPLGAQQARFNQARQRPAPQSRPAPQAQPRPAWAEEEPDFSDILSDDNQNVNQTASR